MPLPNRTFIAVHRNSMPCLGDRESPDQESNRNRPRESVLGPLPNGPHAISNFFQRFFADTVHI